MLGSFSLLFRYPLCPSSPFQDDIIIGGPGRASGFIGGLFVTVITAHTRILTPYFFYVFPVVESFGLSYQYAFVVYVVFKDVVVMPCAVYPEKFASVGHPFSFCAFYVVGVARSVKPYIVGFCVACPSRPVPSIACDACLAFLAVPCGSVVG